MTRRKLSIGVQSFQVLRNDDYVYVDKTEYVWNLVESGRAYFLSRPRRFGKSLMVSTLEAYFRGQKGLFEGLAIEELEETRGENAWTVYPVIKFSLSGGDYRSEGGLAATLKRCLDACELEYGIDASSYDLPNRFRFLIQQLHAKTGRQVVVLVDEYDKPLLETMIVDEEQEERNRSLYKGFFSVLKDEDEHLKFVFFTGVTKFSKVSVFSDLNQLKDISLADEYSGICGVTERELVSCFSPEIDAMARIEGLTMDECLSELARMYDGYHFAKAGEGVYNPFSLFNAFQDKDLRSYWFETGTPTFLIRKLRASSFTPEQFVDGVEASEMSMMDYRVDNPDPVPLFYQSGYLTICGFDREFRLYKLKFPNDEVKYGFLESLAPYVLGDEDAERPISARNMVLDLRNGSIDSFMSRLEALFASVPYAEGQSPEYEREWRNQIFLVFALLGQNVKCEVHSARGRADCIVETKGHVYVFEFKLDHSADEALQQIEGRGYAEPYRADARGVLEIGVNFSTEKRNVIEWKVREA